MLNYKTLLLTLLLLTQPSIATILQNPQVQKAFNTQTRFDASNLDKNNTVFNSFGRSYQIIRQGYAAQTPPNVNGAQQTTQNTHWTKQLGNYQITIPSRQTASSQAANNAPANNNYAVVYNNDSKQIGIIAGNIAVKFRTFSPQHIASIADTYGMTIKAQFRHLNLVFFRVPNGADIALISQQLNADSAIESADIEILENIDVPN